MTIGAPPLYEKISGEDGKPKRAWYQFFDDVFKGDPGDVWVPTFQNLTTVGTPTFSGAVYAVSHYLKLFRVTIVPGTSTSATAGSTYIDNCPVTFNYDGIVFAVSGGTGAGPGHVIASNNRIYVPSWTVVTVPLTLLGIVEAI